MSYYDVNKSDERIRIGRQIYFEALSGRRGFRDDQLGIEDEEIWEEIFIAIYDAAKKAMGADIGE